MRRYLNKIISKLMQSRGYSSYFSNRVFDALINDFFYNRRTTLKQKLWAYKRGFLSEHISFFNLTDENYTDYQPFFHHAKLHPMNGPYSHWIDDKLTLRLILQPFSDYLPQYYYHLSNGEIFRLPDCPLKYGQSIESVINLLQSKSCLAAKLLSGSRAEGFYKLSYSNSTFSINNKTTALNDIRSLIMDWKNLTQGGYLITEYVQSNSELNKFWSKTPSILRLIVIREKGQPPSIISALIHFGTNKSGAVADITAGGVLCEVNVKTGEFSKGKILDHNHLIDCHYHPDTKAAVQGVLPNWDLIKEKTINIAKYIPEVIFMGIDIVITYEGFKILEINSHPSLKLSQYYCPIFNNERAKNFFTALITK